ncbi:MAG: hypothetical protein QXH35_03745 [Nitrososphaerota archaeon]
MNGAEIGANRMRTKKGEVEDRVLCRVITMGERIVITIPQHMVHRVLGSKEYCWIEADPQARRIIIRPVEGL